MDLVRLRKSLGFYVEELKDSVTHQEIPEICDEFGLPPPTTEGTKREKIARSFDTLPDSALPKLAERLLARFPPSSKKRNEIQDILWSSAAAPDIPKRSRREVARVLQIDDICIDQEKFLRLLDRLWVLNTYTSPFEEILNPSYQSLRLGIEKHVLENPDWSVEDLFDKLGALDAPNQRFVRFLEGIASADVLLDESTQRKYVGLVNGPLRTRGVELRETGMAGGYPIFQVLSTSLKSGRPKNLIFASSIKPDIRFLDAVNNDIEIVTNADKVLVYDRPIHLMAYCGLICSIGGVRLMKSRTTTMPRKRSTDDCGTAFQMIHRRKRCSSRRSFAA